jgi:hypothetical protein
MFHDDRTGSTPVRSCFRGQTLTFLTETSVNPAVLLQDFCVPAYLAIVKPTLPGQEVTPMKWNQLLNPPRTVRRLSLLTGYVAGETCSLYYIFVAHTMNPVSYRLVQNNIELRAIYGRYQETLNLHGLAFTLAASFVAFALAWSAVRAIASAIAIQEVHAQLQPRATFQK